MAVWPAIEEGDMGEGFEGGCHCGAIRYEIDGIFDIVYCHCTQCRKRTGAPVNCSMHVRGDAFRITQGSPKTYARSERSRWHFCAACGSTLCSENLEPEHLLAHNGRYYSVNLGTLDDPERVRPSVHQFVECKLGWFEIADELPRFNGNTLPHPDNR